MDFAIITCGQSLTIMQALGAAQDAARMERVVGFYAGLPRGPAPTPKPSGFLERYQARYFNGKNASGMRKSKTVISGYKHMLICSLSPRPRHWNSFGCRLQHGVLLPLA